MTSKAFCPGNVSCIFRIVEHKKPKKMHSLGVGFTVDKGVTVSVERNNMNNYFLNGKGIKAIPTVESVIGKLTDEQFKIEIKTELPFGCGFGLSGACALATAYAINKELNLKQSNKKLAIIAHIAEVENRTGLGDIAGEFNGGFLIKYRKGFPLRAKRLKIEGVVYYKVFGELETKKVITDESKKIEINEAGDLALRKIKKLRKREINLANVIKISKEFALNSGLLRDKRVIKTIEDIEKNKGNASMIMLGNAVFSDKPFKEAKRLSIAKKGAYLL